MISMFYNCLSLCFLPDNISNLLCSNYIFENWTSLSFFVDISNWKISQNVKLSEYHNCFNCLNIHILLINTSSFLFLFLNYIIHVHLHLFLLMVYFHPILNM